MDHTVPLFIILSLLTPCPTSSTYLHDRLPALALQRLWSCGGGSLSPLPRVPPLTSGTSRLFADLPSRAVPPEPSVPGYHRTPSSREQSLYAA
ncbi:hypothetical protein DFH09DRAFT_596132 [Mycena vulgaris]|nr:hypothetical protein DFH09DRAFT_596132 [Mycena vulgaris]